MGKTKEKKYYWLKLKEDFFEDDTIEWIEDQPNGERYSHFYLKLCLKSLKTNGVLIRNVGEMLIPYDIKKLSEITKTDVDTVRVAMELFKNIGLIQILENGEIYLSQLENMVGSESKWAEKKRLQRQNDTKKALPEPGSGIEDNVQGMSPKSPREKEKETEKEKEKETDKQTDKEEEQLPLSPSEIERVELLKDLFEGWTVNDHQINHLSWIVSENLRFRMGESPDERGMRIYDAMQHLTLKAKASNVEHIYGWLLKVIPNEDLGDW